MSDQNLSSDHGLRAACDAVGHRESWTGNRQEWVQALAETLRWVRSSDERLRRTRDFQLRLWEDNRVAAVGQGNISIDNALDDEAFREWIAAKSMAELPPATEDRIEFLTRFYEELKERLDPFVRKTPHVKIFRVIAALFPEAMTTVADRSALDELTRAIGGGRRTNAAERHVWVRERLDSLLGTPSADLNALAERMSLPWMLYARYVKKAADATEAETTPGQEPKLLPLPAARRRRGLTAIRGLFPGVLSTLEFVREGVTRIELLDFLRASSPEAKANSLGVAINVLQSELAVIKMDGSRYVLTERGEAVLESQDPTDLSDWILTRILGADKALVELRDGGPLPPTELAAAIRSMNPGWTSAFVPQALVSWLRSMSVIETTPQYKHALTELGREWAARIDWDPEPLPGDAEPTVVPNAPVPSIEVALPDLAAIVAAVQKVGHFPAALIAQLHAGLWSHSRRHFAILTGLSGAGKTLLARGYANALGLDGSQGQLVTLPVQPGWYDPGSLLGYTSPLNDDSYIRTGFLEFLISAAADPSRPYVAVLDEMNLSHPEQYMAPLLSAMETGESIRLHTEGDIFDGVPGLLPYPRNLVLIGTVNMDETTHGLSDKVLDRAFVLEFWNVDLAAYPRWGERGLDPALENRTSDVLTALMQALAPARLHFGWRVVDDVLDFLDRARGAADVLSFDAALDAVVYAKVLPKLRGEDAPRFREALAQCETALASFGLEQSRSKVAVLRYDLETTGSARFWR